MLGRCDEMNDREIERVLEQARQRRQAERNRALIGMYAGMRSGLEELRRMRGLNVEERERAACRKQLLSC